MFSSLSSIPCIGFTVHASTSFCVIKLGILDTLVKAIENVMVTCVWMKKSYLSPFVMPIQP